MMAGKGLLAVGRNYAAHAKEMGAEVDRQQPFFFTKPAITLLTTIRVATPRVTLTIDANAMKRVLR